MGVLYGFPKAPTFPPVGDLAGKVVLVTGGNTGMGYEVCKTLLAHNAKVYLAARTPAKGERAVEELKQATGKDDIHYLHLDLGSLASVDSAVSTFLAQETRLDILFNNAGVMGGAEDKKNLKPTTDGYEVQFGTNVLGHHALTMGLLPALETAAKDATPGTVRVVSTGSAALLYASKLKIDKLEGDERKPAYKLYSRSKLGGLLWGRAMARKFSDKGIYTYTVHPGIISTAILKSSSFNVRLVLFIFGRPTGEGAGNIIWVGTSPDVKKEDSGAFYVQYMKKYEVKMKGLDEQLTERLWEWLEERRMRPRKTVQN